VLVDEFVDEVNLAAQCRRIVVARLRAHASKALLNIRTISEDSLLTMVFLFLSHRVGTCRCV